MPTANDMKMAEVGRTDVWVFIMLNGLPPKYESTRKFFEVIEKYGISYWKIFKYISSNNVTNKTLTSKIIVKGV